MTNALTFGAAATDKISATGRESSNTGGHTGHQSRERAGSCIGWSYCRERRNRRMDHHERRHRFQLAAAQPTCSVVTDESGWLPPGLRPQPSGLPPSPQRSRPGLQSRAIGLRHSSATESQSSDIGMTTPYLWIAQGATTEHADHSAGVKHRSATEWQ